MHTSSTSRKVRLALASSFVVVSACVPLGLGSAPGSSPGSSPVQIVDRASVARTVELTAPRQNFSRHLSSIVGSAGELRSDCEHVNITAQPIATLRVVEPVAKLAVRVEGGIGFYIAGADTVWHQCNGNTLAMPDPMPAGDYAIYPVGSSFNSDSFKVFVYGADGAPRTALPTSQVVTIDSLLAEPKLVTVKLQPGRRKLPETISGSSCEDYFMPEAPDLRIDATSTARRLTVRMLPRAKQVVVRVVSKRDHYCAHDEHGPSDTLSIERDRGPLDLSFGASDDRPGEVTLMFTDETTTIDPVMPATYGGSSWTLAQRVVTNHFPLFLTSSESRSDGNSRTEDQYATLFEKAPSDAFVYAATDLEDDQRNDHTAVIRKGEALLVLEVQPTTVGVVTVDGLFAMVQRSRLSLARPDRVELPAVARPLTLRDDDALLHALAPENASLATARSTAIAKRDTCRDKAAFPFWSQLPQPAAGFEIAVKSARYLQIEAAGYAAADRACKTDAGFDKKILEPMRVRMRAAVAKQRAALLARASARFAP